MHNNTPHREAASRTLSRLGRQFFEYIEFDDDEELIAEIHKHPFGLLVIELTGFLISVLVTGATIAIAFALKESDVVQDPGLISSLQPIIVIVGLVLGVLGIGATFLAGWIYKNNVIFVTNEKIAQVLYTSILNRKVSQLSIGDVQDVTISQKGLFSRLFRFGKMVIETAGEQQNYTFTYIPNPYENSQVIVGAHEKNLRQYGN